MRGPVTRILRKLGCGFVLIETGDEVFFDSYALDGIGIDELAEGQWVEFELYELEMGRATITRLRSESSTQDSRCAFWGSPRVFVEEPMVIGPSQDKTSAAVRSFVIWGEELSRKGRYAPAERVYQRALSLVERTLGTSHPLTAEVLECYAELLVRTDRRAEGIAMKSRAEAVWKAYSPRFCRTYTDAQPYSLRRQEREGSD
jgi:cold shock CspA family protein